ncbi:DUF2441 domain-containing protein [Methylobacterium sp. ID0610]|uniref:DUF2441 domain-containing protein n=1 Tax=Methylobacterium carpenticola TaxID=3344827 RepID=UPI00367FC8F0
MAATLSVMAQLYYASRHYRKIGEFISPGHYGRMIGISQASHYHFAREQILEKARLGLYRSKPSRLKCVFACATEDDIRQYVEAQMHRHPGKVRDPIYEVETTDEAPDLHRGDWNMAETVMRGGREAEIAADLYWRGKAGSDQPFGSGTYMETITTSPLIVIRRLD